MDAKDNGAGNPFADTLSSLAWIASAMDAARRHTEQQRDGQDQNVSTERAAHVCGDPA